MAIPSNPYCESIKRDCTPYGRALVEIDTYREALERLTA